MKKIIFGLGVIFLAGCSSAPIQLPSNVMTVPSGMGQSTYIDKIDHSFIPSRVTSFEALKVCAATVFTNDGVMLRDNAGSFVGAYTGHYYQQNNSKYVGGSNLFKLIDEKNNILIASGNKKTRPQQGGLIVDIIKYDAKISINNNQVNFVFQNIQAAQESTGVSANTGFRQIGTWPGARAPAAVETLNNLALSFKQCVN